MKTKHLDNAYNNIFKDDKDILSLGLPIIVIYQHIFSINEAIFEKKYNLLPSQIDVLVALLFNGKIMTPTDLYDATIYSSGGMTKILKKLEYEKLITREANPNDKRSKLVKITFLGEKLAKSCLKDITNNYNKLYSPLDEDEKKVLKKLLKKVSYSLFKDK